MRFPSDWLDNQTLPKASTISRYRFHIDVVRTLLIRERFLRWFDSGEQVHILLKCDSSPRGGREWLFIELFVMSNNSLEGFVETMCHLEQMRSQLETPEDVDPWHADYARNAMKVLRSAMWHCMLSPVCLGSKNLKLAPKFVAVLHSFRLITDCWRSTK